MICKLLCLGHVDNDDEQHKILCCKSIDRLQQTENNIWYVFPLCLTCMRRTVYDTVVFYIIITWRQRRRKPFQRTRRGPFSSTS